MDLIVSIPDFTYLLVKFVLRVITFFVAKSMTNKFLNEKPCGSK